MHHKPKPLATRAQIARAKTELGYTIGFARRVINYRATKKRGY